MFLNNIISWGMVAMLTSLTMTTGSVDRNSTSSQNNNPAAEVEATEGKGCAANICPLGTEPFHFDKDNYDYTLFNVTNVTTWLPGYNPDGDCIGDEVACLICVGLDFVEGEGANMTIKSSLEIEAEEPITDQARVLGSFNDIDFLQYNKNN